MIFLFNLSFLAYLTSYDLDLLREVSQGVEVRVVSMGESGRVVKAGNVRGCELCAREREKERPEVIKRSLEEE